MNSILTCLPRLSRGFSLQLTSFLVMIVPSMKASTTTCLLLALLIGVSEEAAAQQPLLSPRDSVESIFNGKKISVNYGRPSMRGRKIMGGLVPFNKVWRTGANEATAFVTEATLVIGGVELPKGSYTLYTLPSETRWKLIINKQTGQWGTEYNADLDFARIDMRKRVLKEPVEKFTIALERLGPNRGVLKLIWELTEVSVRFTVRANNASTGRLN